MKPLPKSDQALVVGTDFSDDAAWNGVVARTTWTPTGCFAISADGATRGGRT